MSLSLSPGQLVLIAANDGAEGWNLYRFHGHKEGLYRLQLVAGGPESLPVLHCYGPLLQELFRQDLARHFTTPHFLLFLYL